MADPTEPNACGWCGVPDREHLQRWTKGAGWHVWSAPTQEQRKERMLARAAERRPASGMPHTPAQGAEDGDSLAELTSSIAEYVRACKAEGCSCYPIASNAKVISHWCRNHGVLSVVPAELTWTNPGIRGGEPCMVHTRVPVEDVSTLLEDGATWEQVKDIYPSIPVPEEPREAAQPPSSAPGTVQESTGMGTGAVDAPGGAQGGSDA